MVKPEGSVPDLIQALLEQLDLLLLYFVLLGLVEGVAADLIDVCLNFLGVVLERQKEVTKSEQACVREDLTLYASMNSFSWIVNARSKLKSK